VGPCAPRRGASGSVSSSPRGTVWVPTSTPLILLETPSAAHSPGPHGQDLTCRPEGVVEPVVREAGVGAVAADRWCFAQTELPLSPVRAHIQRAQNVKRAQTVGNFGNTKEVTRPTGSVVSTMIFEWPMCLAAPCLLTWRWKEMNHHLGMPPLTPSKSTTGQQEVASQLQPVCGEQAKMDSGQTHSALRTDGWGGHAAPPPPAGEPFAKSLPGSQQHLNNTHARALGSQLGDPPPPENPANPQTTRFGRVKKEQEN
jgi:hypothetical protein